MRGKRRREEIESKRKKKETNKVESKLSIEKKNVSLQRHSYRLGEFLINKAATPETSNDFLCKENLFPIRC